MLRLPIVQTHLGKRVTNYLNDSYGTNMKIKKVDFSFLGNVKLKDINIKDHKNDSLIYVKSLVTSVFSYKNILDNRLELGEVDLEGVKLNMITHKGEKTDNLAIFAESFDKNQKKNYKFYSFFNDIFKDEFNEC